MRAAAPLSVLEIGFIAFGFAMLVIGHRDGAITRPFAIADPIISRGGDPTIAIIVIGGLAAVAVILLLNRERRITRSLVQVALAVGLLLFVGSALYYAKPYSAAAAAGGLGLRKENSSSDQKRTDGQSQQSKPSDDLEFRNEYPSQQRVPVAVVLLHDDYSPSTGTYYFRQGAFSQYNGRRLVAAVERGIDEDIADRFPSHETPMGWQPPHDTDESVRYSVKTTVGLLAGHTRPFGLESPISMAPAGNPAPNRFQRTYRVRSAVPSENYLGLLGRSAGNSEWDDSTRKHYLEAPSDLRYRELLDDILEGLPDFLSDDAVARAVGISMWLSQKGTYSLRNKHARAADPTAHFLFGDLVGYCVHFAHAATYLMRVAGLPARVATGYAIPESARQGGSAILLSAADSHAWPEVFIEGVGWMVVDVTPQQTLDPPPPPPDESLQRLLGEMMRGTPPIDPETFEPQKPLYEVWASVRGPLIWGSGFSVRPVGARWLCGEVVETSRAIAKP